MPDARRAQLAAAFRQQFTGQPAAVGPRAGPRGSDGQSHRLQPGLRADAADRPRHVDRRPRERHDRQVRLYSLNLDESVAFDLDEPAAEHPGLWPLRAGRGADPAWRRMSAVLASMRSSTAPCRCAAGSVLRPPWRQRPRCCWRNSAASPSSRCGWRSCVSGPRTRSWA